MVSRACAAEGPEIPTLDSIASGCTRLQRDGRQCPIVGYLHPVRKHHPCARIPLERACRTPTKWGNRNCRYPIASAMWAS